MNDVGAKFIKASPFRAHLTWQEYPVDPRITGRAVVSRLTTVLLPGLFVAACSHNPKTEPEMWRHFNQVGQVQSAVIAGDLDAAKTAATWVAERDSISDLASNLRPYEVQLRNQARTASQASTIAAAALATGEIGKSCGDCHQASGTPLKFNYVAAPPKSDQPVTAAMLRHQWGADRMWNGLIGNSDSAWVAGARALAEESTYSELFNPRSAKGDAMRGLAAAVRRLGREAATTTDHGRRAQQYGELLGTCAACHRAK
jgi:cytochrome c553